MAEAPGPGPVGTWTVRIVGGDPDPFHEGREVTIRREAGNEMSLEVQGGGRVVGTVDGPHLRFEVEDEKGPLLWRLSRHPRDGKDQLLLGATFRRDRGDEATGVWMAEGGEGVDPLG